MNKNIYAVFVLVFLSLSVTFARDTDADEVRVVDEVEDISNHSQITTHKKSGEKETVEDDDTHDSDVKIPISEKKRAVDEHHLEEEKNHIEEEVKAELDKAVESLKESAKEKQEETNNLIVGVGQNLEPCGAIDCNNRGTCIGSKKTFICACQLGYSGKNCEETVCDSARDCNGRGLCLGTTNQLTCLCNLGFSGRRCETPI